MPLFRSFRGDGAGQGSLRSRDQANGSVSPTLNRRQQPPPRLLSPPHPTSTGWEEADADLERLTANLSPNGAGPRASCPCDETDTSSGVPPRPMSLRLRPGPLTEEMLKAVQGEGAARDSSGSNTTLPTTAPSRPGSLRSRAGSVLEEALQEEEEEEEEEDDEDDALKGLLSAPGSPPVRPVDTYLPRSSVVRARGGEGTQGSFLRRIGTKEHLPSNGGNAGTGTLGNTEDSSPPQAGGGKVGGQGGSGSGGPGHERMDRFCRVARAFEKKRLAIMANLRHRSKLSLLLLCPLLLILILLICWIAFSHNTSQADAYQVYAQMEALLQGPTANRDPARERFTVMINTYRRHDMAKDAVQHYANCDRVDAIRVVWSENSTAPQDGIDKEWYSERKAIFYDKYSSTSLNNRFVLPDNVMTDAVFAVDDDIRVSCEDLDFAHEVWKVADQSLVGFMPRIHTLSPTALNQRLDLLQNKETASASTAAAMAEDTQHAVDSVGGRMGRRRRRNRADKEGRGSLRKHRRRRDGNKEVGSNGEVEKPHLFRYNGWWKVWWTGEYSLVLTKAAFLHRNFLRAYTEEMPARIRDYVDENRNCEDIAMQFLAANLTGKPPLFVRGHLTDLGVFKGISTKSWTKLTHMKSRSQCLNDFVDLYGGKMPLVKSSIVAGPASSWWFNQPATIFEYFSSDLLMGRKGGIGAEGGKRGSVGRSVRRAKAMHLIPLLALMVLVVIKLMYG